MGLLANCELETKAKLTLECAAASLCINSTEVIGSAGGIGETNWISRCRVIQDVGGIHPERQRFRFRNPEGLADVRIKARSGNRMHGVFPQRALMTRQWIL